MNRQFANPNGTAPDSTNGFGGLGGGFLVVGTSVTVPIPSGIRRELPGADRRARRGGRRRQLQRCGDPERDAVTGVGLSASDTPVGGASDALTLKIP